jgi:hypothetical protein
VTYDPKLRPTMQCQVGLYFLSNSFLMNAAMSFSMLYFSRACGARGKGGQARCRVGRRDGAGTRTRLVPRARDDLRECSGAKNGASRRPSAAVRERETSDHEDTVRERDRAVIAA